MTHFLKQESRTFGARARIWTNNVQKVYIPYPPLERPIWDKWDMPVQWYMDMSDQYLIGANAAP